MIDQAIDIATKAHNGQVDKAGQPYIGHSLRVMSMGTTGNEKIVGVLHDVVEDSDWTFERLTAYSGAYPFNLEPLFFEFQIETSSL